MCSPLDGSASALSLPGLDSVLLVFRSFTVLPSLVMVAPATLSATASDSLHFSSVDFAAAPIAPVATIVPETLPVSTLASSLDEVADGVSCSSDPVASVPVSFEPSTLDLVSSISSASPLPSALPFPSDLFSSSPPISLGGVASFSVCAATSLPSLAADAAFPVPCSLPPAAVAAGSYPEEAGAGSTSVTPAGFPLHSASFTPTAPAPGVSSIESATSLASFGSFAFSPGLPSADETAFGIEDPSFIRCVSSSWAPLPSFPSRGSPDAPPFCASEVSVASPSLSFAFLFTSGDAPAAD
mmetsp:Transcript_50550/g.152308  ORF Transcript_50550/g.152308 Transcript_50550/m.152308 type:complete len:298 (+) Transcript_50550:4405-5298(+)